MLFCLLATLALPMCGYLDAQHVFMYWVLSPFNLRSTLWLLVLNSNSILFDELNLTLYNIRTLKNVAGESACPICVLPPNDHFMYQIRHLVSVMPSEKPLWNKPPHWMLLLSSNERSCYIQLRKAYTRQLFFGELVETRQLFGRHQPDHCSQLVNDRFNKSV